MLKYLLVAIITKLWAKTCSVVQNNAYAHTALIEDTLGLTGIVDLVSATDGEAVYRLLLVKGAQLGSNMRIYKGLTIHNVEGDFSRLCIGDDCHIGTQVFLDMASHIVMGNRVTVSMRTMILTHMNAGSCNSGAAIKAKKIAGVTIEDDVYIGAGAIILPGVTIGKGALIGAAAVVTRDVPPNSIMLGSPARNVRTAPC